MKLREYLDGEKINPADFAKRVGVTPVALYRYMAGTRQPRPVVIDAIIKETDGRVEFRDLFVKQVAA